MRDLLYKFICIDYEPQFMMITSYDDFIYLDKNEKNCDNLELYLMRDFIEYRFKIFIETEYINDDLYHIWISNMKVEYKTFKSRKDALFYGLNLVINKILNK